MPIREFECESCHHKFEEILGLNDPNPTVCPKCGKGPLKSILSSFRIAGVHKKSAAPDEFGAEGAGEDLGGDLGGGDEFGGGMGDDLGGGGDFGGGDLGMGGGDEGLGDDSSSGGDDLPAEED